MDLSWFDVEAPICVLLLSADLLDFDSERFTFAVNSFWRTAGFALLFLDKFTAEIIRCFVEAF